MKMNDRETQAAAAQEVTRLCQRILELAPEAGIYVGIKITDAATTARTDSPS